MLSLGGGLPATSLFPYETIEATVPRPDAFALDPIAEPSSLTSPFSWLWSLLFSSRKDSKHFKISIPKYAARPDRELQLATALQYGTAQGLPQLRDFMLRFTRLVHRPPPEVKHEILVTTGNTDAWCAHYTAL